MKFEHLLVTLSLVTGHAFAQGIHPDLNIPKVDFTEFERHQNSVKEAFEEIDLKQEGKVEALSVSVPDYREAHAAFAKNVLTVTSAYSTSMDKLKNDAEAGAERLKILQGDYSSKLYALEDSIKKYPLSADTFKKSYAIEQARMRKDLDQQYKTLLQNLSKNYSNVLTNVLNKSSANGMNVRNPNVLDRAEVIVVTPALTIATLILWAAPAPLPFFYSVNAWCDGDTFLAYGNECGKTFWGVLEDAHNSVLFAPKKAAYNKISSQYATSMFVNCKTSSCVFELAKDYKIFLMKMIDLNEDIQVGDATLQANPRVKKNRVRKLLKAVSNIAAQSRPTAIYTQN